MAVVYQPLVLAFHPQSQNPNFNSRKTNRTQLNTLIYRRRRVTNCSNTDSDSDPNSPQGEISPFMPKSCRYVPTCSEYSMEAYRRYGVAKSTILTAWRLCRCNPLGGSGYDPPRWFDETISPEE